MNPLLSLSPIGVAVINFDGSYAEFNDAYCTIYGYTPDLLRDQFFTVIFSPDQRASLLRQHQLFLTHNQPLAGEWDVFRRDGAHRRVIANSVRVTAADGQPQRLVYITDITERQRAEAALQESEQRLMTIIASAMDAVICLDHDHRISLFNPAAERMFGCAASSMLGQTLDPLLPPAARSLHAQHIAQFGITGLTTRRMGNLGQLHALRANGEQFPIEASISQGKVGDKPLFTVIVRDVTVQVQTHSHLAAALQELGEANQQLTALAHLDHLTRLPNRLLFLDRLHLALSQANRRGTHVCLAYIDLDGFKAVNDNHGHDAGDALLVELSSRLREQLREGDTIARLGGDEFVALLTDIESFPQCTPIIERMLAVVSQPVPFNGAALQVSASIGVASSRTSTAPDELLRQADDAMYGAKRRGKNQFVLYAHANATPCPDSLAPPSPARSE